MALGVRKGAMICQAVAVAARKDDFSVAPVVQSFLVHAQPY